MRRHIDRRIQNKKVQDQGFSRARISKEQRKEYLKGRQVTIDQKTQKEIDRLSADLARFNEGASPSRRMARLVRALENVQGKDKVPADQLNELNRAALTYYNKREGVILSGPVTSNGKGRLETVGELSRIIDELMKPVRSQMREDLVPKGPAL